MHVAYVKMLFKKNKGKNFRTAPYLIMHVHLTGDTLKNKAPYMDVYPHTSIYGCMGSAEILSNRARSIRRVMEMDLGNFGRP